MAKKINKKLIGILTTTGMVVLIGAGFAVVKSLAQRDPEPHLARAKEAYAKGELTAAVQHYYRAFNYAPDRWQILMDAATVAWEAGDFGGAKSLLDVAITSSNAPEPSAKLMGIYYQVARMGGGLQTWQGVADLADKLLPDEPGPLADFEKQYPAIAAQAYFQRGMASLARSEREPSLSAAGVADLRRVVYPDPSGTQKPLDPANVDAAETLKRYWLFEAGKARAEGRSEADVGQYLQDAANLVKAVMAAADENGTLLQKGEARMLRLIRAGNNDKWSVPEPLVLFIASAKQPVTQAVLDEVEKVAAELAKLPESESRPIKSQIIDLRLKLASAMGTWGDNPRRREYLRETMKLYPDDPAAYMALGEVLTRKEDTDDAKALYRSAIDNVKQVKGIRAPIIADARAFFFDTCVRLELQSSAASQVATGPSPEAIASAEKLSTMARDEFGVDSSICKLISARLCRARSDNPKAIRLLEEIEKQPLSTEIAFEVKTLLTDLYTKASSPGLAEEAARSMIRLKPSNPLGYLLLADSMLTQKKPDGAIEILNVVLVGRDGQPGLFPNLPQARRLMSQAYAQKGLTSDSDSWLPKEDIAADRVRMQVQQAVAELDQKKYAEAEARLKSVLQRAAAHPAAVYYMVRLLVETDRATEVKPVIEAARAADPENLDFQKYEIAANESLSDEERIKQLTDVEGQQKDPFERAKSLFELCRQNNQLDESRKHLEEAEKVKPDSPWVIEQQFQFALIDAQAANVDAPDRWKKAEEYVRRGTAANADESGGKVFAGRLKMAQAELTPNKTADESAKRSGLYTEAIKLLQEALQVYRANSITWTYLGQAQFAIGELAEARISLQKAIDINSENGFAHWAMAAVLQKAGDAEGVRKSIRAAARDPRLQNNAELRTAYQQIQEDENPADGITRREKVLAENPKDVENMIRLAQLYARAGRKKDVLPMLQKAREAAPDDLRVSVELAREYQRQNKPTEAVQLFKDSIEREKEPAKKATIMQLLAQLLETSKNDNDLAKAAELYEQSFQLDRSAPAAATVGQFFVRVGDRAKGLTWFEEARKLVAPEDKKLSQRLLRDMVQIALSSRDAPRTDAYLKEYAGMAGNDPELMLFQARLAILQGNYEDALSAFSRNISQQPDNAGSYWQRGVLYAIAGDMDRGIEDLRKARDYAPGPPKLPTYDHRMHLAQCYVSTGRINEAIAELKSAMDDARRTGGNNFNLPILADAVVEVLLLCDPPRETEAENILLEMANKFPGDPTWPIRIGDIAMRRKDYDIALQKYETAAGLALDRKSTIGLFASLSAIVRCNEAREDPARTEQILSSDKFKTIVESAPVLAINLAAVRWRGGKKDEAWTTVTGTLTAVMNRPGIFAAVAQEFLKTADPQEALTRVDEALKSAPGDAMLERLRLCLLLALHRADESAALASKLHQAGKEPADKAFPYDVMAAQYYKDKEYEAAAEAYRKLLEIQPDNPDALNNLAWILSFHLNRPVEALPYAEKAVSQKPDNADLLDTLGFCQALTAKYREARETLFRCLRQKVDYASARYHMGLVCKLEGRNELAVKNLRLARQLAVQQKNNEVLAGVDKALKELNAPAEGSPG